MRHLDKKLACYGLKKLERKDKMVKKQRTNEEKNKLKQLASETKSIKAIQVYNWKNQKNPILGAYK